MAAPAHDAATIVLTGVATPELYRRNAFRLSGLPADASARELRRRTAELEAGERLGAEWTPPPSPGRPPPDPDRAEVHRALRELRDPARRIVDELFWLRPMPGGGVGGADLTEAGPVWAAAADGGEPAARAAALHNRAVTAHAQAVEQTARDTTGHASRWRTAYRNWRLVLAENACWDHLRDRATAIGDPRLRPGDVDALRERLPHALVAIHASLAVEAAEHDPGRAPRELKALRACGFDAHLIDTALRNAVGAHAGRMRTTVGRLRSARLDGEAHTDVLARAMTAVGGPDLRVLRTVLGEEHELAAGIADELASCIRECVVGALNATHGLNPEKRAEAARNELDHLESAAALAVGAHAKAHIEQDLAVVLNNLVVALCDKALQQGEAQPQRGLALQKRLVQRTRPHVDRVVELDTETAERLHDDIAGTSLALLYKYFGETRDLPATLDALRGLQGLATGPELRGELAQAIRVLESARASADSPRPPLADDLFARPARSDVCVLCGRSASAVRSVHLVGPGTSTTPLTVARLPSCASCVGRSIGTAGHQVISSITLTTAFALAVVGGIATGFTWDGVLGWVGALVAVAALSRLLSTGRRGRQNIVAEHPEIRSLLRRGHRIVR